MAGKEYYHKYKHRVCEPIMYWYLTHLGQYNIRTRLKVSRAGSHIKTSGQFMSTFD
jgi:hypothetical protein